MLLIYHQAVRRHLLLQLCHSALLNCNCDVANACCHQCPLPPLPVAVAAGCRHCPLPPMLIAAAPLPPMLVAAACQHQCLSPPLPVATAALSMPLPPLNAPLVNCCVWRHKLMPKLLLKFIGKNIESNNHLSRRSRHGIRRERGGGDDVII
jgi:hypothetical protein